MQKNDNYFTALHMGYKSDHELSKNLEGDDSRLFNFPTRNSPEEA
jgi:hypothetical protein